LFEENDSTGNHSLYPVSNFKRRPVSPTILVGGQGTVRWLFRPGRFLERLSPAQLLAAIDEHLPEWGHQCPEAPPVDFAPAAT
jgi:hypothetical protein